MTAPDPRLEEIEGRLSKATPGPWKANKDGTIDGSDYAEVICHGQVNCMAYCLFIFGDGETLCAQCGERYPSGEAIEDLGPVTNYH